VLTFEIQEEKFHEVCNISLNCETSSNMVPGDGLRDNYVICTDCFLHCCYKCNSVGYLEVYLIYQKGGA
jgi:hypothetical protein